MLKIFFKFINKKYIKQSEVGKQSKIRDNNYFKY